MAINTEFYTPPRACFDPLLTSVISLLQNFVKNKTQAKYSLQIELLETNAIFEGAID
jgi:hypothetical protein